jgi:hypothetical protein
LLDWTFSPYVALHFVTENLAGYEQDGSVWCVDYVGAHKHLPKPLRAELRKESADVFTTEMLGRVTRTLPEFDRMGGKSRFALFFEPPSLDERIVNQFALFSLMSGPTASMESWLTAHPDLFRRFIIPASLKWEIRDKLDQANVTERVLFPGLDGLSRWLRRYYTPRGSVKGDDGPGEMNEPLPPRAQDEDASAPRTSNGHGRRSRLRR